MFNSADFLEIPYLQFDPAFSISLNDNRCKIIFGPNGVGKTSIYNFIRNKYQNYKYIDYELKHDFIIVNKNIIKISPSIYKIEQMKQIIREKLYSINPSKKIKKFITKTTTKEIDMFYAKIFDNEEALLQSFTLTNLNNIRKFKNEFKFAINNFNSFSTIKDLTNEIIYLKDAKVKEALNILYNHIDDDETICPACHTRFDQSVKNIIKRNMDKIKDKRNKLVSKFSKEFPDLSSKEAVQRIENIIKTINDNNITFGQMINFAFVPNHTQEEYERIEKIKYEIENIKSEINKNEHIQDQFFYNIMIKQNEIKSMLNERFKISYSNIEFDNKEKVLNISFSKKRDLSTYSTSEKHLIVLLVKLYEFVASDSPILVIDDPLCSYDIPNQYVIMYEIISKISNGNNSRLCLIFSHNVDTINIANAQKRNHFDCLYMECTNKVKYLNKIDFTVENVFDIRSICQNTSLINHRKYIELLLELKNNALANKDSIEPIFHYDDPHSTNYQGENFSNDYFVDLIENLPNISFNNMNFSDNCVMKIIYLVAIRVWIEKKFYDEFGDRLRNRTLGEKINYIFPKNGSSKWTGSPNVTRGFLMSKKVMLNQNKHTEGQSSPFYFALNLTLDDIYDEITVIKGAFI
ncbi:MAG TPA: hypothetical protein PLO54_07655 [Bacilli bacterium]|nr:hypothetical protein [Bacilli bacterium]